MHDEVVVLENITTDIDPALDKGKLHFKNAEVESELYQTTRNFRAT